MAFFILQACPVRYATPKAVLMTHNMRVVVEGAQLQDLKDMVKEIDSLEEMLYTFVAKRMGMKTRGDLESLHRLAGGNYYILPHSAKALKVIDGIVELDFKLVK
jgi:ATP-dependent protease ClpP protease subunit